jgi:hypothetical protein
MMMSVALALAVFVTRTTLARALKRPTNGLESLGSLNPSVLRGHGRPSVFKE